MSSYSEQRREMVSRYKRAGYIKSKRVEEAIMAVPREEFMESNLKEYALSWIVRQCLTTSDYTDLFIM